MAHDLRDIVIVGGGLAAAKAAEAARAAGFDGRLVLFSDEAVRPYERPSLSKGHLAGVTRSDEVFVHHESFYGEHDIDLRLTDPVVVIDRASAEVATRGGHRQRFDRLLLATGASPVAFPGPGGQLDGVWTLRTLDDGRRLRDALDSVGHLTVIGGGWIGSEVAATARTRGVEVAMVVPGPLPLARVLGTRMGRVFRDLHAAHGVDLRLGVRAQQILGDGRAEAVALDDGSRIDTDLVVVGIGVRPNVALASGAGLRVTDGVAVDGRLRSSDERIFAAGDVAQSEHPTLGPLRVEHWANALNQGTTAGLNLLGQQLVYDRLPYFYTDQFELGMEYAGQASDLDNLVVRGDLDTFEFIAFWLDAGRVVATMNVNVRDVVEDLQSLITSGQAVAPGRLEDPDVPLAELVPARATSGDTAQ
jgi:3-phenylpropionate/trans-cinnamate dioxygenase ferredoxin reductase subunit